MKVHMGFFAAILNTDYPLEFLSAHKDFRQVRVCDDEQFPKNKSGN